MTERTILCFGDSNTHGTVAMVDMDDRRRLPKAQRWPSIMASELGGGWDVVAEGHPGRNAAFDDPVEGEHKNGLRVLPALLESHRPLDLVIIMLGTNDLKARFSVPAFDIALALERLAAMVSGSDAGPDGAAPKLLLASPVPIDEIGFLGEMFAGGAEKSRALPRYLKAIADRQNARFVDLAEVAKIDSVDGIHLDAAAQAAVGNAMCRAVRGMFV